MTRKKHQHRGTEHRERQYVQPLYVDGLRVSDAMPVEFIANLLLKKYNTPENVSRYRPYLHKIFKKKNLNTIMAHVFILYGEKVKHAQKDAEQIIEDPRIVDLPVKGVRDFAGQNCFIVQYSPEEGVQPYDWFVPIPEGVDGTATRSIPCIFHDHSLTVDKTELISTFYEEKAIYFFSVTNVQPAKKGRYRVTLKGRFGDKYRATCIAAPPIGRNVRARVDHIARMPAFSLELSILLDEHLTTKKETGYISTPRKAVSVTPQDYKIRKLQSEVEGYSKHKCGKPFTCNCCGMSFLANEGWRVELKEIYLCNACARRIYVPGKRGNRHFYITTPMGNKR